MNIQCYIADGELRVLYVVGGGRHGGEEESLGRKAGKTECSLFHPLRYGKIYSLHYIQQRHPHRTEYVEVRLMQSLH